MSLLIRGGTILTMNDRFDVVDGDVSIRDGRIAAIGSSLPGAHDRVIDARGGYVLPGLVQTHIHLCQTLFRGFADDLPLMDWLRTRVWPMEAAHRPDTLRAAARLATTELLSSGTTAVLTMETVHDTDVVFETVAASGMRATIGKCMMDFDAQVPKRLQEKTFASIEESLAIRKRWDGAEGGRLRAAFAPRFAVSCSRELLEAVAGLSAERHALVHTHASESRDEIAIVRKISGGLSNLEYLASLRLASPQLCAAHCVWVDDRDQQILADHDVKVMHCPGSNLKLGSGVARCRRCARAASRSRSAPTAPPATTASTCSRRCASPRSPGDAQTAGRAAGARRAVDGDARGRANARPRGRDRIARGGKKADVIIVDRDRPHLAPGPDPYSTLVYAARGSDVRSHDR
jgi:cytosine/adenosine deaminase-related metal-dependent hydrolase